MSARLISLDVLRFVAVVSVIFRHMPEVSEPGLLREVLLFLRRGGWVGVDLFFVLSGFLVSGLLFRELDRHGELRIGAFLLRRGLKIYPAFYVFLGASLLSLWWLPQMPLFPLWLEDRPGWQEIVGELVYLQNYLGHMWWHTWSLAIEEHFYLVLALSLGVLTRRGSSLKLWVPRLTVGVMLWCVLARTAVWVVPALRPDGFAALHDALYFPTHMRLDALCFGVLLSYLHRYHADRLSAWMARPAVAPACIVVGTGMMGWMCTYEHIMVDPYVLTVGLTQVYLGAGLVLMGSLSLRLPAPRVLRAVAYVGQHSYSVYLWHMVAIFWMVPGIEFWLGRELGAGLRSALMLALSLAVGVAMSLAIEAPVLRLRNRLLPSRAGTLSQ